MSDVALALRQVRFENRSFWRNPAAAFFTFAFPLIFMVIFNVLFGGNAEPGAIYPPAEFFTPAIVALSVITACYTNIAMSVTAARDEGILKRCAARRCRSGHTSPGGSASRSWSRSCSS